MSRIGLLLAANLPSTICFGGATAIALTGNEGWGWFLLLGGICFCTLKSGKDDA